MKWIILPGVPGATAFGVQGPPKVLLTGKHPGFMKVGVTWPYALYLTSCFASVESKLELSVDGRGAEGQGNEELRKSKIPCGIFKRGCNLQDVLSSLKTTFVKFFFCSRLTFPEKSPKRVLGTGFLSFFFLSLTIPYCLLLLTSMDIFGGKSPLSRPQQSSDMKVKMAGHINLATASNLTHVL